VEVIATDTRSVRGVIHLSAPLTQITDLYGVTHPLEYGHLAGIELSSGSTLWELSGREFGDGYSIHDDALVQKSLDILNSRPQFEISVIDLRSGTGRIVFAASPDEDWRLWTRLSSNNFAVLARGSSFSSAAQVSNRIVGSTLDLETGAFEADAIDFAVVR